MKTTININGKSVEIELTSEQVAEIQKKSSHYTNIKTLQDALNYKCETMEEFNHRTQFDDDSNRAIKELEVIVHAVRQGKRLGNKRYYPYFYNPNRSAVGFSPAPAATPAAARVSVPAYA